MRSIVAVFTATLLVAPAGAQFTNCMAMGSQMVNCQSTDGSTTNCMAMGPQMATCNTIGGPSTGGFSSPGGPSLGDIITAIHEGRVRAARSRVTKAIASGDCVNALKAVAKADDVDLAVKVRDYCASRAPAGRVSVQTAPVAVTSPRPLSPYEAGRLAAQQQMSAMGRN